MSIPLANPAEFTLAAVLLENRVLIRSTCKKCGASRVVSVSDGSLRLWEDGHKCRMGAVRRMRGLSSTESDEGKVVQFKIPST
jgi:hypothetical protein